MILLFKIKESCGWLVFNSVQASSKHLSNKLHLSGTVNHKKKNNTMHKSYIILPLQVHPCMGLLPPSLVLHTTAGCVFTIFSFFLEGITWTLPPFLKVLWVTSIQPRIDVILMLKTFDVSVYITISTTDTCARFGWSVINVFSSCF